MKPLEDLARSYDQSPFTSASPKQLLFCHSQTANGRIGGPRSGPYEGRGGPVA